VGSVCHVLKGNTAITIHQFALHVQLERFLPHQVLCKNYELLNKIIQVPEFVVHVQRDILLQQEVQRVLFVLLGIAIEPTPKAFSFDKFRQYSLIGFSSCEDCEAASYSTSPGRYSTDKILTASALSQICCRYSITLVILIY
jgi:hypothetical protein